MHFVIDAENWNSFLDRDFTKESFDEITVECPSSYLQEIYEMLTKQFLTVTVKEGTRATITAQTLRGRALFKIKESRAKKVIVTEGSFLQKEQLDKQQAQCPVQKRFLKRIFTEEEMLQSAGKFFDLDDFTSYDYDVRKGTYDPLNPHPSWTILTSNSDVYDADTGEIIVQFRKQRIPFDQQKVAYDALQPSAKYTRNANRGVAGGIVDEERVKTIRPWLEVGKKEKYRVYPIKEDGTIAPGSLSNGSRSAIVGWTDVRKRTKTGKNEKCRLTLYTEQHMKEYQDTFPFFQTIDRVYKETAPEHWSLQKAKISQTTARIADTTFSSITVNYDWRSALHKDKGDYKKGLGVFTVCQPRPEGGELLLPEYGLAVRVCSGDVLLFNSHRWHCTAPLHKYDDTRLSFVCYLREKMPELCPAKQKQE